MKITHFFRDFFCFGFIAFIKKLKLCNHWFPIIHFHMLFRACLLRNVEHLVCSSLLLSIHDPCITWRAQRMR